MPNPKSKPVGREKVAINSFTECQQMALVARPESPTDGTGPEPVTGADSKEPQMLQEIVH